MPRKKAPAKRDKNAGRVNLNIKEEVRDRLYAWGSKNYNVPVQDIPHGVPAGVMLTRLLDIAEILAAPQAPLE